MRVINVGPLISATSTTEKHILKQNTTLGHMPKVNHIVGVHPERKEYTSVSSLSAEPDARTSSPRFINLVRSMLKLYKKTKGSAAFRA